MEEGKGHGRPANLPAPSMSLSGLPNSPEGDSGSGPRSDQPCPGHDGRAPAASFGGAVGAATRPWWYPAAGRDHWPEPHNDSTWHQGIGTGDRAEPTTHPSRRRRSQAPRKKRPGVVKQLHALVEDTTAGDPSSGMRWTRKSTRTLAKALRRLGFRIGSTTVGRLLKAQKYSLRTNRKCLARTHEPERDRQFRYIIGQRRRFQKQGNPAVSIDTKKKEQVGLFKNPGRTWRRVPVDVWDHDFPSWGQGRGI